MGLDDAIVTSAGGDFGLLLLFFLIATLVGLTIYALKKILDQNAAFNAQILIGMKNIADEMKEYKRATCSELHEHDIQAKEIQKDIRDVRLILEKRPCIAGNDGGIK